MTISAKAITPHSDRITRTPYHLSPEQLEFFDDNGYLILRNWVPHELLDRLQGAGHAWIEQGLSGNVIGDAADYRFVSRPNGPVMYRVDYLHNKGQASSLELLGSPYVLAVAESMCGPNFVPTYEAMVFKQQGDGKEIPWHQDAVHPGKYRIFNVDLYLDESLVGAGALRVIPGTQRQKQDVCAIADQYGWDHPDAIDVEMHPGDVLLHNVMVVHGSDRTLGKALRRTIYYEFRPAEEILEDGPWDRDFIQQRHRLVPISQRYFQQAFPDVEPFTWNVSDEFRPPENETETEALRIAHLVHMSGSFCSVGDAGKLTKP